MRGVVEARLVIVGVAVVVRVFVFLAMAVPARFVLVLMIVVVTAMFVPVGLIVFVSRVAVLVTVALFMLAFVIVFVLRHCSISYFRLTVACCLLPVAYLFFAIPSMISHCSSVTFMIDNRELRTRSKFLSFGCALT